MGIGAIALGASEAIGFTAGLDCVGMALLSTDEPEGTGTDGIGSKEFGVVRGVGLELIIGAEGLGEATIATGLGYFWTWNVGTLRPAQAENHQNMPVRVAKANKILTCIEHHKKH